MSEFRVGCAVFKQEISPACSQRLFTKEVLKTIHQKGQWWLCLGIYKEEWKTLFELMQEAHILKLELGRNEHSHMIEDIKSVGFPMLKALCFGKNRIVSIEGLQHIVAPCLQWLSFEENYLTNIRSLRKANFPHLKVLNLKTNKINQIDMRAFHTPALSKLTLQVHHTADVQSESLNWVFTLESTSLLILRCRGQKRIRNRLFQQALQQKYREINIKRYDVEHLAAEEDSPSDHE